MTIPRDLDREHLAQMDRDDPLQPLRDQFVIPDGVLYLDGNSLGALPRATAARLQELITDQWGDGLVRSWNNHDWINLPRAVGAAIAPLIGAQADEVMVADSTSVNLFKLLAAALQLRPGRREILAPADDFPTDLYVAEGLSVLLPDVTLRLVDKHHLAEEITDHTAVILACHVAYRDGGILDMARLTAAAHARGALALWDLCHSAGALPVDLDGCAADLAVGCGYKYLNGGPGAPSFLYVAERHIDPIQPAIAGWMGHATPFTFQPDFVPATGIRRMLSGTPTILGLAALQEGVRVFAGIDMRDLRKKSIAMGEAFMRLVQPLLPEHGFAMACPADPALRGSQVSISHPHGYPIMQALIARGVIGDFRAPDVLRFGFTPLYLRYTDLWDTVHHLRQVMDNGEWRRTEFNVTRAVT